MSKANKTRYALLGILSMHPASGYEIKKIMQRSTDHFWREGDSSIYPILKKLLDEGLVSCKLENIETDKPKKLYTITRDGLHELEDWLEEDPVYFPNRNELLLKTFFGWNVGAKITINHIENFRRRVEAILKNYQSTADKFLENKISGDKLYRYLTLKAGIMYCEASLKWCDEAIQLLKKEL